MRLHLRRPPHFWRHTRTDPRHPSSPCRWLELHLPTEWSLQPKGLSHVSHWSFATICGLHSSAMAKVMIENGSQKFFCGRILRLPGLCFSSTPFLYHVISGRGTPRAWHSNFRVLLPFTSWFVKFWVSQGRFRATVKHTHANFPPIIQLWGYSKPNSENGDSAQPTINSECSIFELNPPVEVVSKALVASGVVWGHTVQSERTRNGMFPELETGQVGRDGPIEGVQPLQCGVEVASCPTGQSDVITLDGWRGLDVNLLRAI